MKIAFIQNVWEDNLGILIISAILKNNSHKVKILINSKEMFEKLYKYKPDILAFSCTTGLHTSALRVVHKIKSDGKIEPFVIVGGPHATYYPEFVNSPGVDAICRGEGEYAMLDLANKMDRDEDICHIKNLWVKSGNSIFKNPVRLLIQDLSSLPHPDRSYYDEYPFLAKNPYRIMITSRGCPFECTFCFNHVQQKLYGKSQSSVRQRSVDDVIQELKDIRNKWGLKGVRFVDDHFTLNKKWLKRFCQQYQSEIGSPYTCNARADGLDEEKIGVLKESGCRIVHIGVETGNEDLRNIVLGKKISNEEIENAVGLLKKNEIKIVSYNIIGLPGETTQNAFETIELTAKLGVDYPWCSVMQFYPGTQIHQYAMDNDYLEQGFSLNDMGTYFDKVCLKQNNRFELQNIHRFFLVWAKFPFLINLMKPLIKCKSNRLFDAVFLLSYAYVTLRRSNMGVKRIIQIGIRSLHLFKK